MANYLRIRSVVLGLPTALVVAIGCSGGESSQPALVSPSVLVIQDPNGVLSSSYRTHAVGLDEDVVFSKTATTIHVQRASGATQTVADFQAAESSARRARFGALSPAFFEKLAVADAK